MTAIDAPPWCRWRRGSSAVLVVAPHGGRREPRPSLHLRHPRQRKVNDLHTAELAEELADALDAALIVNPVLDRNHLDLNRISQVAARAPWFLALIEELVADILARHERAEVLFVHGWNVIQAKCDIGVGHAFADAAAAVAHADALTISPGYAAGRLDRLRVLCAGEGIAATFGDRYAARHPNNLLQLFRAHCDGAAAGPRLAAGLDTRRIEAVQLELGVPVRWPGICRHAFVRAAATAFRREDGARPAASSVPTRSDLLAPPVSLQLYDPSIGLGLTARIDEAGPHRVSGRVLVFLGNERLALFIGEDARSAGMPADGPRFTAAADGFRLRFAGTALATEHGALYVDLEQGFATSRLCSVAVDLRFRRGLSADFGAAAGWVEIDGTRRPIDAPAFARHGILQRPGGAWSSQVVLSAAFGGQRAVRVRSEFPGSSYVYELTTAGEARQPLPPLYVRFDGERQAPVEIVVADPDAPFPGLARSRTRVRESNRLHCHPLSRMTITRPLTAHRHARVSFGAARFLSGDAEGFGFYEYARALT